MYESLTYEVILARMLKRVSVDVDASEGSLIYTAIAPAAWELSQIYAQLDHDIEIANIDTATEEYLDLKTADYGLTRKAATYSIRKINTSGSIDIGTRWSINDTTYIITQLLETNTYKAACEQSGTIGNIYFGELTAINFVGEITATLGDIITLGAAKETDDNLRSRLKEYLSDPSQDGNIAQYKKWATDYERIGTAKVFPLWNGGNTVKIAITNANFLPAENSLISDFQTYMDPNAEGKGNGVAPIGSKVIITGGTQKDINISANIVLSNGYTDAEGAAAAITSYLAEITFIKNSVSYMKIGSTLLDCDSIAELNNLVLNSQTSDIAITGDEIPVLKSIDLVVITS